MGTSRQRRVPGAGEPEARNHCLIDRWREGGGGLSGERFSLFVIRPPWDVTTSPRYEKRQGRMAICLPHGLLGLLYKTERRLVNMLL